MDRWRIIATVIACSRRRPSVPCAALSLLSLAAATVAAQDPPRFTERVDVSRVLVDVRVIDRSGGPMLGLTAESFDVRIDGKPARVESAQWVAGALAAAAGDAPAVPASEPGNVLPPAEGRLIVFVFQKSLEPGRIVGFMRMLLDLKPFLDAFTPHDRVAVVSFDTRLRLWLDFTGDMDRVRRALAGNVLFERPPPEPTDESPALFQHVAPGSADRAYTIESALRLLAAALKPLPGAKSVVLVGHGFGRLGLAGRVLLDADYDKARDALQDARASVFCLDVTHADYHSLEVGLQTVATDTGGFFERTHLFGGRALERLGAALAGHYVLIVEKPAGRRGQHRLDVRLKDGRSGTVLAREGFVD